MGHGKANDIGHWDLPKAHCVLRSDPRVCRIRDEESSMSQNRDSWLSDVGLCAKAEPCVGRKIAPRTNIVDAVSPLDCYPPTSQNTRVW